jgi:quercetin dioxygenase-like cupin family protein
VTDEILFHRGTTMVRRLWLGPGETMPWHHDPYHRVAVVLRGNAIAIEYLDRGESHRIEISPGQVEWEEPIDHVHRAVNVGGQPYEQIAVFLLDRSDAVPQPNAEPE